MCNMYDVCVTNLLDEIVNNLKAYGYKLQDIKSITTCDDDEKIHSFDIKNFLEVAKTIDYDAGYGGVKIDLNLRITMNDGSFFQRAEYDGSEWFEYYELRDTADVIEVVFNKDKILL